MVHLDVEADTGSDSVSLVVEKAARVEVLVLGPDDKPLAGSAVSAFPIGKDAPAAGFLRDLTFETDVLGVAHMRRLRPGGHYRLTVSPPRERDDLAVHVQEKWPPAATTVRLQARVTEKR